MMFIYHEYEEPIIWRLYPSRPDNVSDTVIEAEQVQVVDRIDAILDYFGGDIPKEMIERGDI